MQQKLSMKKASKSTLKSRNDSLMLTTANEQEIPNRKKRKQSSKEKEKHNSCAQITFDVSQSTPDQSMLNHDSLTALNTSNENEKTIDSVVIDKNNNIAGEDLSIELESESEHEKTTNVGTTSKTAAVAVKRITPHWSNVATYSTFTEAHKFIVSEGFKKHNFKDGENGRKTNYFCGRVKQKAKSKCKAKHRIVQSAHRTDFQVEASDVAHTCTELEETDLASSASEEMAKLVIECRAKRMTAKNIVEHINSLKKDHNLFPNQKTPKVSQIYNILRQNKNATLPTIEYLGELIEWCEENMDTPGDIDKPFVIGLDFSDDVTKTASFRLVVSTKRMIEHCGKVERLCVDATYKLVWQDYPFMVVGFIDKAKKFHPLAFALCVQETTADFRFIFESLAEAVEKYTGQKFEPKILISDASDAIRNAFMAVFPNAEVMIMCYVHVLRNIDKNRQKFHKDNRPEILKDINTLHLASSVEIFQQLVELFLKKWKKKEPQFATYFQQQWLGSHCNWYEGAAEYTPSTNNSLEGNNKHRFFI